MILDYVYLIQLDKIEKMKADEILKLVQRMYRTKRFELDEEQENILECEYYRYERSGNFDDYTESGSNKKHFCTIEFAKRLLPKTIVQRTKRLYKPKNKSRLKIFGKLVNQ